MTKAKFKGLLNKYSTIINVMKGTKTNAFLHVIVKKGGSTMPTTKELLLDFIQYQKDFNNQQKEFNTKIESKVDILESKVDSNSSMIKQAHPELFNK